MAVNAFARSMRCGVSGNCRRADQFSGMRSQDSAGRYMMIKQALVLCQHIQSVHHPGPGEPYRTGAIRRTRSHSPLPYQVPDRPRSRQSSSSPPGCAPGSRLTLPTDHRLGTAVCRGRMPTSGTCVVSNPRPVRKAARDARIAAPISVGTGDEQAVSEITFVRKTPSPANLRHQIVPVNRYSRILPGGK